MVNGFAREHIGTDHDKRHGILLEGFHIKDVVLLRHDMVAELGVEIISTLDKRAQTTVTGIFGKTGVVADGTSWLARLVVTAKGCSRRDANESIWLHTSLHHHIDDACREESAHSAAFKYQSFFHGCKGTNK